MKFVASIVGCLSLGFTSCASLIRHGSIKSADKVDLSRYMGSWRIIACTDNKVERDFVDAVETYRFTGDGRIGVHFAWRDKSFSAPIKTHDFSGSVQPDGSNARWKMKIFPVLSASYIIIAVAPDYSSAAVAHPSRKFGWILARERTLPKEHYDQYMRLFEKQGYDISLFKKVPQHAEEFHAASAY